MEFTLAHKVSADLNTNPLKFDITNHLFVIRKMKKTSAVYDLRHDEHVKSKIWILLCVLTVSTGHYVFYTLRETIMLDFFIKRQNIVVIKGELCSFTGIRFHLH